MPLKSLMIFLVLLASSSNALSISTKNAQFQAESNSLKIFKSTLFLQEESTEITSSSDDVAEKTTTESTSEATDTEGDKIEDGDEEEEIVIASALTIDETAPVGAIFLQEEDTIAIAADDDDAAEKTDEDEDILDSVDSLVEGLNQDPNGDEQYTQNFLQIQNGLESFIELSEVDNTGSDDTSVKVEDEVEDEQDEDNVDGLQTDDDKPEKTT